VIESLPRFLFPTHSRGLRWLREQLRDLGVSAPLSPGCMRDFVASAAKAAPLARSVGETYAASLRKQLEARARFIHRWTTTDDKLTETEWSEWADIARRHLLPRSWSIPQTTVSESRPDNSFAVPERLVVKGPRSLRSVRHHDTAKDLPGTEILSDLKRAGDKS
jgi:hypothetical protein